MSNLMNNIDSVTTKVENFLYQNEESVMRYTPSSCKRPKSLVVHLRALDCGVFIGTMTAYDSNGYKSAKAFPIGTFMSMVGEVEEALNEFSDDPMMTKVFGYRPSQNVVTFLKAKNVHRLFFIEESNVLDFVKLLNSEKNLKKRSKNANMIISVE
ncbi:hypothetical protein Goe26_01580 [Bacillus phage vB_BsuM-Goe26]|nr:hypothetical protein Goe26_01580 [Bacillus phage vB_BsuM-Goe26]